MAQDINSATEKRGPGPDLRKARDEAGRSLGELAAEMHVGVNHLQAIEANEFSSLGGRPYVKSYIRAYARSLELDPEPYLQQYEDLGLQDHQWKATDRLEPVDENRQQGVLFGMALVLGALLIAFVFWFFSGDEGPETEPMEDVVIENDSSASAEPQPAESEEAQQQSGLSLALNGTGSWVSEVTADAQAETAVETETEPQPEVAENEESEAAEEEAEPANEVTESDTAEEQKAENESDESSAAEEESTETEASAESAQAAAPDNSSPQIGEGPDKIELELSENSWLEIQESNGNVLLRGLLKAGAVREISGQSPFQVFLGNAPGVDLRFNGEAFATSSYTKSNNTARFALVRP